MAGRTKRTTKPTPPKKHKGGAPPKWTSDRVQAFIEAVVETCGNVSDALLLVGMGRTSFYEHCNEDPKFNKAVTDARDRGVDVGEDRMRNRAYKGVRRYEIHQGRIVYLRNSSGKLIGEDGKPLKRGQPAVPLIRREYSDAIAVRIMEAYRQNYRTRRHEMTGDGGGAIQTQVIITIPDNGRVPKGAASGRKRSRTGRGRT